MATKFVRSLTFSTGSSTARVSYWLKLMYEFWGFCVYGGASLTGPLGFAGNTTIAAGSNGASLPTGTINVVSTTGFPTSGTAWILSSTGTHLITYTGTTATTLTGATGGTGTLSTGGTVASTAAFGGSLPLGFNGIGTIVASGSNGASLPQGTINVVSTTGFPASGTIYVFSSTGTQIITYTGTTSTTFTGCTGGTGTLSTGNNITSASLLGIGNDGYTNASTQFRADGYNDFFCLNGAFHSNMVGKQLVTWKANSGSTEDSIYNIIAFKSPTNIVVNVNNGGTPSVANSYRPSFTSRSSINYRVIDTSLAGSVTGIADGNFLTFQFDPTGINTGQANAQLQLISALTQQRIDYRMSPNGSWTGSTFGGDASATTTPNVGNSNSNQQMQNTSSNGNITTTLIGDKSFFIGYGKDQGHSSSSGFHWHAEIPDRLYSQTQDPNPFAVQINGYNHISDVPINASTFSGSNGNNTYAGGFVMRCNDGVYRNWRTTSKALIGDGGPNYVGSSINYQNPPGPGLTDIRAGANTETGGLMNSYGFLSSPRDSSGNPVVGQYSYVRCRLRNVRFANTFMKTFTRFYSNGDYLLLTDGVAWPWDNSVVPITLFPLN